MRCRKSFVWMCLFFFGLLSYFGCASIQIRKIDPETQQIIGPSGVRYYLPRPYVAVNEPFVVFSKSYIVNGVLSPDGQYILLQEVQDELSTVIKINPKGMGLISTRSLQTEKKQNGVEGNPQSDTSQGKDGIGEANSQAKQDENKKGTDKTKEEEKEEGEEEKPSTDIKPGMSLKVASDNSGIPVTPLKRYFDIVWLPDFDEQYLIQTKSGLGNAKTTIQLLQGWGLQGIEAVVDNSAIVKPLLDFYASTFSALQKLTTAKITAPLDVLLGTPQAETALRDETAFANGIPVSVKLYYVKVATPGLYPILKPKELKEIEKKPELKDIKHRILPPVPPFTNIAFNTYETFYIEALQPSGDNVFKMLQTKETDGGRTEQPIPSPRSETPPPVRVPDPPLKTLAEKINSEIKNKMAPDGSYYSVELSYKDSAIFVQVNKNKGNKTGSSEIPGKQDDLKTLIIDMAAKNKKNIEKTNIVFEK